MNLEMESGTKFIYRRSSLGEVVRINDETVWFTLIGASDFSWRALLSDYVHPETSSSVRPVRGVVSSSIPIASMLSDEGICTFSKDLQGFSTQFLETLDSNEVSSVHGIDHNRVGSSEGNLSIRLKSHLREFRSGNSESMALVTNTVVDFLVQREAFRSRRKDAEPGHALRVLLGGESDPWERLLLSSPITTRNDVRDVLIQASMRIAVERQIDFHEARAQVCEHAIKRLHRIGHSLLDDLSVMS